MNENTKIECYHGTSKERANSILIEGFKNSQIGNWLGKGVYFYENIYYAIEWGIIYFLENSDILYAEYTKKCAIIKAVLDWNRFELLDLNDPVGYKYYLKIVEEIKSRFPKRIESIKKGKDIEIIRLIEEIERETGEKYISMFDILIANYPKDIYKKGKKGVEGNFLPCIQKQICVKNQDVIEKIENIDLEECDIKQNFDIIKENREEYENEKQCRAIRKAIRKDKKYSR